MADSDEKNEIGDIDPPKDWPGQPRDPQSMAVLIKIGHGSPQDHGDEDEKSGVKKLSCPPDGFKQNGVLFRFQGFFVDHIPSER